MRFQNQKRIIFRHFLLIPIYSYKIPLSSTKIIKKKSDLLNKVNHSFFDEFRTNFIKFLYVFKQLVFGFFDSRLTMHNRNVKFFRQWLKMNSVKQSSFQHPSVNLVVHPTVYKPFPIFATHGIDKFSFCHTFTSQQAKADKRPNKIRNS